MLLCQRIWVTEGLVPECRRRAPNAGCRDRVHCGATFTVSRSFPHTIWCLRGSVYCTHTHAFYSSFSLSPKLGFLTHSSAMQFYRFCVAHAWTLTRELFAARVLIICKRPTTMWLKCMCACGEKSCCEFIRNTHFPFRPLHCVQSTWSRRGRRYATNSATTGPVIASDNPTSTTGTQQTATASTASGKIAGIIIVYHTLYVHAFVQSYPFPWIYHYT